MDTRPDTQSKPVYAKPASAFADGTPMQSAKRELHEQLTDKRFWMGFAAIVVIVTVAGPFGTGDDLNWLALLAYWTITAFSTYIACLGASAYGTAVLKGRNVSQPTAQIIAAVPAGIIVFAIVMGINALTNFTNPPNPFGLMLQCVLIAIAINVMFLVLGTGFTQTTVETKPNLILDKLPADKRGAIIHIETQDHYLNVTTTKGRDLILMRMSDAAAALDGTGIQTHRSHWVATQHVTGSSRENNRWVLTLSNGATVPVSRPNVAALRAQGLLPPR